MNVLIACSSGYGSFYSCLGLATFLKGLVSKITIVSGLQCREISIQNGCAFFLDPESDGRAFDTSLWFSTRLISEQVKHITKAVELSRPDLLISNDLCLGAFLVAEKFNLPIVVVGFGSYLYPVVGDDSSLADNKIWRISEMYKIYNEARELLLLPKIQVNIYEPFLLGDLYLLRSLPQTELGNLPQRILIIGPFLWEPQLFEDVDLLDFLSGSLDDIVIYCQIGRLFDTTNLFQELTTVFGNTDFKLVIDQQRMENPTNYNIENIFTSPHIPFGKVLDRASVLISTGMTTSYLGSIQYGIPILAVSSGGSGTDVISKNILDLGIGVVLSTENCNAKNLALAIKYLLGNKKIQNNVLALSKHSYSEFLIPLFERIKSLISSH